MVSQKEWIEIDERIENALKDNVCVEKVIANVFSDIREARNNIAETSEKQNAKLLKMIEEAGVFAKELDAVLNVLEQHSAWGEEHDLDGATWKAKPSWGQIEAVMKCVAKYCCAKAKENGYIEYCKIREAGLSERKKY